MDILRDCEIPLWVSENMDFPYLLHLTLGVICFGPHHKKQLVRSPEDQGNPVSLYRDKQS